MKKSIKLFAIALIALVTVSSSSFAANHTTGVDTSVKKDWMLLAKQSEYLMNKNSNLETAKVWLEESLSIEETAYNLELMGDLHSKNKDSREAVKYYIKAMDAMKTEDATIDTKSIQTKIKKAKK